MKRMKRPALSTGVQTSTSPTSSAAREALRELATFALLQDPCALARRVEQVNADITHDAVDRLRRWLERYKAALPQKVQ